MRVPNLRLAALALTGGLMLGGCAYGLGNPYGSGVSVGYGYGNYGYGNYGYGSRYGYPYGGYGYGYNPYAPYGGYDSYYYGGSPYYGWNNGWYYPGTGYYVYDRDRRRRTITDAERQYWREKFNRIRSGTTTTSGAKATTSSIEPRANWSGFDRVRVRSADRTTSSRSRSSERSRSTRSRDTSSSSSSSDRRSSDFMRRHSPKRSED